MPPVVATPATAVDGPLSIDPVADAGAATTAVTAEASKAAVEAAFQKRIELLGSGPTTQTNNIETNSNANNNATTNFFGRMGGMITEMKKSHDWLYGDEKGEELSLASLHQLSRSLFFALSLDQFLALSFDFPYFFSRAFPCLWFILNSSLA
jgi:hypothetical protein